MNHRFIKPLLTLVILCAGMSAYATPDLEISRPTSFFANDAFIRVGGSNQSSTGEFEALGARVPVNGDALELTVFTNPIDALIPGDRLTVNANSVHHLLKDGTHTSASASATYNSVRSNKWAGAAVTVDGAPGARYGHLAIWTGSHLLVWGGYGGGGEGGFYWNDGGVFDPISNVWTAITTTGAPEARVSMAGTWTGSRMMVFGGSSDVYYNSGALYDPAGNSWTATTTNGAPEPRVEMTAVWDGSKVVVWGGAGIMANLNTGAKYSESTDSWIATTTTNGPPAVGYHSGLWTGSKMLVWGGYGTSLQNTGGLYDSSSDSWSLTTTTNAPAGRYITQAVWSGSKMLVWGGYAPGISNTGGVYDPGLDSWATITTAGAPSPRTYQTSAWTGSKLFVWGGFDGAVPGANTGGEYDPTSNTWTATTVTGAPAGRLATADVVNSVYGNSEVILWGGSDVYLDYFNDGGIYFP